MSWIALALGALVGACLGLLGGGGSVLAIPLLTYGLGLEAKAAVATSLVVIGAAALAALAVHARQGNVLPRVALGFGLLGALGALGGSQLARLLSGSLQLLLFTGILFAAGWRLLRQGPAEPAPAAAPQRPGLRLVLAALATGLLTGVVGVGGGFLIVPALVFLLGLPMRQAIGTSLAVIVLNALGGSLGYLSYVELDLATTLPFVIGASLASVAGGALSQRLPARLLRVGFGLGLLLVGLAMLVREGSALWAA